jgi:peptide deformylase
MNRISDNAAVSEELNEPESESPEPDFAAEAWIAQAGLPPGVPRPITVHGTPVLHHPCAEVTDFGPALRQLVADMFASMAVANGVGLAANQIGVDARVFVFDCPDGQDAFQAGCVVNPQVFLVPGDLDDGTEGCLSVPGPFAPLARPEQAYVTGQDLEGNPIRVDGTGLLARCLQHETDHLNGIVYVDRLDEESRAAVMSEYQERLRSGKIPDWSAAYEDAESV